MATSNTHRAGVRRPDGTWKLLASGSFQFCSGAVTAYREHSHNVGPFVVWHYPDREGYPPEWDRPHQFNPETGDTQ